MGEQCSQEGRLTGIEQQLGNGRADFRDLRDDIKQLLQDVAALKTSSRMWGAAWGIGAAIGGNIIIALVKAGFGG